MELRKREMNSTFKSHSTDHIDDLYIQRGISNTWRNNKYATIEKSQNLNHRSQQHLNMPKCKLLATNCEWLRRCVARRTPERPLTKSHSNVAYIHDKMQYTQKSVNRNGTIARHHFRGVPGEYLDKQTKHFLQSMTVSTFTHSNTDFAHNNSR